MADNVVPGLQLIYVWLLQQLPGQVTLVIYTGTPISLDLLLRAT